MQVITLKGVKGVTRTKDPVDGNRYIVRAYLPAEEIQQLAYDENDDSLWANPRVGADGSKDSPIAWKIEESFTETHRGDFHSVNRGVILLADSVRQVEGSVNGESSLTVSFDPRGKQGLADGGTTTQVITRAFRDGGFLQSDDPSKKQWVSIEIRCGKWSRSEAAELVEALNFNKSVDACSLANYRNEFKDLQTTLEKDNELPSVSSFFGQAGDYEMRDVLTLIASLFYNDEHGEPDSARVYSGASTSLKFFEKKENQVRILPFIKNPAALKTMFDLYETIPFALQNLVVRAGQSWGWVHGDKDRFIYSTAKTKTWLPYLQKEVPFKVHKAWRTPLFSAFRVLINEKKGTWKTNPVEVYKTIGGKMFLEMYEMYQNGQPLRDIATDKHLYSVLSGKVERAASSL